MGSFYELLGKTVVQHPKWRVGQCAFNALLTCYPALAEKVRGTDADPFYVEDPMVDPRWWKFNEFLAENLA